MGVLMLSCPTTGREFSTGIFADEETFEDAAEYGHQGGVPLLRSTTPMVDQRGTIGRQRPDGAPVGLGEAGNASPDQDALVR